MQSQTQRRTGNQTDKKTDLARFHDLSRSRPVSVFADRVKIKGVRTSQPEVCNPLKISLFRERFFSSVKKSIQSFFRKGFFALFPVVFFLSFQAFSKSPDSKKIKQGAPLSAGTLKRQKTRSAISNGKKTFQASNSSFKGGSSNGNKVFQSSNSSSKAGASKRQKTLSMVSKGEKTSKQKPSRISRGRRSTGERFLASSSSREGGFVIGPVKKNHPFDRLRLKEGDAVKRVNESPVSSKKSFLNSLRKSDPEKKSALIVERGGEEWTVHYSVRQKANSSRRMYQFVSMERVLSPKSGKSARKSKTESSPPVSKKKITRKSKTEESPSVSKQKIAHLPDPSKKKGKAKSPPKKKITRKSEMKENSPVSSKKTARLSAPSKKTKKTESPPKKKSTAESSPKKNRAKVSFNNLSKKEKKLLSKKSGSLQESYVIQINSKVYKRPDFDARHIYTVPAGTKALVSKKIFSPPSRFGTFYKVFLYKDKKVVGYISEIDVVPRFEKDGGINPRYAILEDQIHGIGSSEREPLAPERKARKKKLGNRFAGLSFMTRFHRIPPRKLEVFFAGLKFSGYDLLVSYLNMDINVMTEPGFKNLYFDILGLYELFHLERVSLYAGGGLEMNIEFPSGRGAPGLVFSLGLRKALLTGVFWQSELRASLFGDFSGTPAPAPTVSSTPPTASSFPLYRYGFLTSFQFQF